MGGAGRSVGREQDSPKTFELFLGSNPPLLTLALPSYSHPTATHYALPTPTTGFGLREE